MSDLLFTLEEWKQFHKNCWQRECKIWKGKFPSEKYSFNKQEILGFYLEEDLPVRYFSKGKEKDFVSLGGAGTSILLNDLQEFIPELIDVYSMFQYIPRWRFDDCMVNFSMKNGSVGPHYDRYDVFIIQISGTKEWQLAHEKCDQGTPVKLDNMPKHTTVLLEPGDILYIPPYLAHYGVAKTDDNVTLSVGMRMPEVGQILTRMIEKSFGDEVLKINEASDGRDEFLDDRTFECLKNDLIAKITNLEKDVWSSVVLESLSLHKRMPMEIEQTRRKVLPKWVYKGFYLQPFARPIASDSGEVYINGKYIGKFEKGKDIVKGLIKNGSWKYNRQEFDNALVEKLYQYDVIQKES